MKNQGSHEQEIIRCERPPARAANAARAVPLTEGDIIFSPREGESGRRPQGVAHTELFLAHGFQIRLLILVISLGVLINARNLGIRQLAFDFRGHTQNQAMWGNDRTFGQKRSGPNNGIFTDSDVIEQYGAHPDQTVGLDGATMQHDSMADRYIVTKHQWAFIPHDVPN